MKVVILYHPFSEFARPIEEFARDFEHQMPGRKVELLSLETTEGATLAKTYDIVRYPAIIALRDDGQILKFWEGETLPLMNEVASYVNN